jgi:hypothetical protein
MTVETVTLLFTSGNENLTGANDVIFKKKRIISREKFRSEGRYGRRTKDWPLEWIAYLCMEKERIRPV